MSGPSHEDTIELYGWPEHSNMTRILMTESGSGVLHN